MGKLIQLVCKPDRTHGTGHGLAHPNLLTHALPTKGPTQALFPAQGEIPPSKTDKQLHLAQLTLPVWDTGRKCEKRPVSRLREAQKPCGARWPDSSLATA